MNNPLTAALVAILDSALAQAQANATQNQTSVPDELSFCVDRSGNRFATVYTTMTDIALHLGLKSEDAKPGGKLGDILEDAMPGFLTVVNTTDQFAFVRSQPFEYAGKQFVVRAYGKKIENFRAGDRQRLALGIAVEPHVRNQVVLHIVRADYAEERTVKVVEMTEQRRASLANAL